MASLHVGHSVKFFTYVRIKDHVMGSNLHQNNPLMIEINPNFHILCSQILIFIWFIKIIVFQSKKEYLWLSITQSNFIKTDITAI